MGFATRKASSNFKDINLLNKLNEKLLLDFEYEQYQMGDYEMIYPLKVYDPDQDKEIILPSPNFPYQNSDLASPHALSPQRKGSLDDLNRVTSIRELPKITSNKNLLTIHHETPMTDRKIGSGLSSQGGIFQFRMSPDLQINH